MGANALLSSETDPVVSPYVDGLTPWERFLPVIMDCGHWTLRTSGGQSRLSGVASLRPAAYQGRGRLEGWGSNVRSVTGLGLIQAAACEQPPILGCEPRTAFAGY